MRCPLCNGWLGQEHLSAGVREWGHLGDCSMEKRITWEDLRDFYLKQAEDRRDLRD